MNENNSFVEYINNSLNQNNFFVSHINNSVNENNYFVEYINNLFYFVEYRNNYIVEYINNNFVEYINNSLNQNNYFVERIKLFGWILQHFINHVILTRHGSRYIKHTFYRPHYPVLYIAIGSKFGKNSFLLAKSFPRVLTRLLLLVYKTNVAKTNIAGKEFMGVRACPQKLYHCFFWHTYY